MSVKGSQKYKILVNYIMGLKPTLEYLANCWWLFSIHIHVATLNWIMIIGSGVACRLLVVKLSITWWRHQMETFSALLTLCARNSPVTGESPSQRPVTQWRGALMFPLIFALNKQLSKQSWGWWFETPSRSLWRHCNVQSINQWPAPMMSWRLIVNWTLRYYSYEI